MHWRPAHGPSVSQPTLLTLAIHKWKSCATGREHCRPKSPYGSRWLSCSVGTAHAEGERITFRAHVSQGPADDLTTGEPVRTNHEAQRSQRRVNYTKLVSLIVVSVSDLQLIEFAVPQNHLADRVDQNGSIENPQTVLLCQTGADIAAVLPGGGTEQRAGASVGNRIGFLPTGRMRPAQIHRLGQEDHVGPLLCRLSNQVGRVAQIHLFLAAHDVHLDQSKLKHWLL
ncbi:MAG: hypothetical protein L0Z62_23860 [Gemmataceae bacterium]|nr:hypothetical protein [Gemmataceae bacterium]